MKRNEEIKMNNKQAFINNYSSKVPAALPVRQQVIDAMTFVCDQQDDAWWAQNGTTSGVVAPDALKTLSAAYKARVTELGLV